MFYPCIATMTVLHFLMGDDKTRQSSQGWAPGPWIKHVFHLNMCCLSCTSILHYTYICIIIYKSLEVKLPTIWTDEKQSREEAERRERLEERRVEEKEKKKEDADARKGRKVAKHCVFPMIWGSGQSKSRLAKAAGAEPAGQMRDEKLHAVVARSTYRSQNAQNTPFSDHFWKLRCRKKCTPLWREAHFQVKMYKTLGVRTTFGS